MKKALLVVIGFAVFALLQSCAGSHKSCGAYAKHETGNQPSYQEVQ